MEIQIVKPTEFHKRKSLVEIPGDIKEKYTKLFQQYNCFSDNAVIVIQPSVTFKQVAKKSHPSILRKEPKTVKKHMLGILNVINDDNYRKMLLKTKIYINKDNIKEIFEEILDKCCYQIFYIHVYMSLIRDLMISFSEKEHTVAVSVVNEFILKFVSSGYLLEINKTEDSYHDFCILQKKKMSITAKNLMLIHLLETTDFVKVTTFKSYSDMIYSAFLSNIHINPEIADVLLQMLIELAKKGIMFNCSIMTQINSNQKLKFMIDDLMKIQLNNTRSHGHSQNPL